MIPPKIKPGQEIRVIAPSRSLSIVSEAQRTFAQKRLENLGFKISFGEHVLERDEFHSSAIESRLADLHAAFADKNVAAILTSIGGYNCNQLLKYLDFDLVKSNPKILCGYSDITALQNAILTKTNLVTYSGPHFSTFGMQQRFDFTLDYFIKCLFKNDPFELSPSEFWSDDAWYIDQNSRNFISNPGYLCLNEGSAQGTIIGGNLCTFNLLQGTEFLPSLSGKILFLEDDEAAGPLTDVEFDRNLQSILHLPDFDKIQGLVIGRFQKASKMTETKIRKIIQSKKELKQIPVIYGVDFGHTDPFITFPIGGTVSIDANHSSCKITILEH